jgi:hypothetical protein
VTRLYPGASPVDAAPLDRTTVIGLTLILASAIFLQRFAIPMGGTAQVPMSFLAGYVVFLTLLLLGRFVISPLLAVLFLAAGGALTFSLLISINTSSIFSYVLLMSIYTLYMFKIRHRSGTFERFGEIYLSLMAFMAALGIAQFFAQFVIGIELAFPIDTFTPETILLSGFNVIIPLAYESTVMRSNGVFFLEPSVFSQFLGMAIILEMIGSQRILRLSLYGVALLLSYSGTGISLVLVFVPLILIKRGNGALVFWGLIGAAIVVFAGEALQLSLLTGRTGEFSSTESSGFARFISPFWLVNDYLLNSPTDFLFGRGSGFMTVLLNNPLGRSYLAHDPTWIKLLFEYGAIAWVLLFTYIFTALFQGARVKLLPWAIAFLYLFLGGYLLNGMMHLLFLSLVAWHNGLPAMRTVPGARGYATGYPSQWPNPATARRGFRF